MKQAFFFISLLLTIEVYSQSHNSLKDDQKIIDSLTIQFNGTKSDSLKCITAFKLSNIFVRDQKIKQYQYYNRVANKLIKDNIYLKDVSYYYNAAEFLLKNDTSKYLSALKTANYKLKKYRIKEIYSLRALILRNQSVSYQMNDNDKEALRVLTEAAQLAIKVNDNEMLGIIYNSIGIIFLNRRDYIKADYYIAKSISSIEKKVSKTISYSETYVETHTLYAEILTQLKQYDKASKVLKKTEKLLKRYPNSNLSCYYYFAKGNLEHHTQNYESAIISFDKGIKYGKLTKDFPSINRLSLMKFVSLKQLKRYDEAKNLLIEILNGEYIHIEDKKNYSKDLSWLYKQLNDYPNALKYSEQYIRLNDSLNEIYNKSEIAIIESKFRNKENENKIKELEIQKQKTLLAAKNDRLHIIVIGLLSVILLLVIVFLLINFKNQKRIAKQNEINYKQSLSAFKIKKELEVMQAMIDGEEKERTRLARDLHDGVGSRLSSLKMQMEQKFLQLSNKDEFKTISDSLTTSIAELRQVAFNLVPEVLLKLGLDLALKDLCYSMSTKDVIIDFTSNEINESIKASHQIAIFRIVQELINNALKHAGCSEIIVDCSQNNDLFLITVEDNGKGFDSVAIDSLKGLGLKNIKNRVELMNGTLDVHSQIDKGTIFNIELCISIEEED
jgi:signal transduction histidine kinase